MLKLQGTVYSIDKYTTYVPVLSQQAGLTGCFYTPYTKFIRIES